MNQLFLMLICLISFSSLQANYFESEVGTGYRVDTLKWNTTGTKENPKILSGLEWKNLKIWEAVANFKTIQDKAYIRGSLNYGTIFSGSCRDHDYWTSKKEEFFRSFSSKEKGYVYDLSLAFGCRFSFFKKRFQIYPLVGYALDAAHLKMKHELYVIDLEKFNYTRFEGLNDSYRSKFYGPFAGFDLKYQATDKISFFGTFEYHMGNYKGSGKWNQKTNYIKAFEHTAKSSGIFILIESFYAFTEQCALGIGVNWRAFKAKKGECHTSIGKGAYAFDQPFKEAIWNSFSTQLTLKYLF